MTQKEKLINGLINLFEKNIKECQFTLTNVGFVLQPEESRASTLLFLVLVITPAIILVIISPDNSNIFLAIMWVSIHGHTFYSIIIRDNKIEVNLNENYFKIESINIIYQLLSKPAKIFFIDVKKIEIKKVGRTRIFGAYTRLILISTSDKRYILNDSKNEFVTNKLKFTLESLIKESKKNNR